MVSGVTDGVKVVLGAGARLCAGWKQLRSRQVAGGREGGRVSLAFLLSVVNRATPVWQPGSPP